MAAYTRAVPGTPHRLAAIGAVAVVAASLVGMVVGDVRIRAAGRGEFAVLGGVGWVFAVAAVVATAVGATLMVRRPGHPVGSCFAALGVSVAVAGALTSYGVWGLLVRPGSLPFAAAAANFSNVMFVVWLVLVGLVCYLTPTGRHLSPAFRRCGWALVACTGLALGLGLVSPETMDAPFRSVSNPWAVRAAPAVFAAVRRATAIAINALVLVGVASLVVRFLRAEPDERRQLLWMALAGVPLPVLVVLAFVFSGRDADTALAVTAAVEILLLPVGAVLGITRYHLYDVERILSRAVTYVLVSAVLAAGYAAVVLLVAQGVGQAAGRSQVSVALATLGVAAAARPVYHLVQEFVDRRFARRRYDAVHTVRQHVAAPSPDTAIEEVLRRAVYDPSLTVAYWVASRQQWVTGDGHPTVPAAAALAVDRAGRPVARVSFDADRAGAHVVRAAVAEAGPELDNAGLRAALASQLEEVRASRTRIATAQFEERRRIERALHDGAQQRLLALAAGQQAALLGGDSDRLRAALRTGVAQSQAAVRELRELANGLHPSVLTDGGLTAALDDLASRLPVEIRVDVPGRRFPPPVEGAVWFVACEAVANAVKHARAGRIGVTLTNQDTELTLTVTDDGSGGADPDGQGLRGIADRVAAARGRLAIDSAPGSGTTLRAVLPCGS
ncbi:sensor histidine kinase [Frankia sp. Cas3]|uniref:sensor histidine kinase n=1 Tax=Frankia sp. Cas3 TaxID=3073926 RepID=UPI002AD47039|nr:histidine kinase [Frankia sp. Cas3]